MFLKPQFACRRILLVCAILISLFYQSCADRIKSDLIGYKALDEGLVNSNRAIDRSTIGSLIELEKKLTDPVSREKAAIWYPKAQQIQAFSKSVDTYIDDIKTALKKEAGLEDGGGQESFREKDKNSVMRVFTKQDAGKKLLERLKDYRADILSVDSELSKEFGEKFLLTTAVFDSAIGKQDFTKTFFDDIPAIAAVAMLSKFQNNVKLIENKTIAFCRDKVGYFDGFGFSVYRALAMVSSSRVNAGEEIEVTAGVGAFSKAALPEITIDSKKIALDDIGAAVYRFKAPKTAGKYTMPIQIDFVDQEGRKQTISKNIEYTVVVN